MSRNSIRALIVHDDPSARKRLRSLLDRETGVEVVAECDSVPLALRILSVQGAELLFLNACLPGVRELQRLGRSGRENAPAIVLLPPEADGIDPQRETSSKDGPLTENRLHTVLRAARLPTSGEGNLSRAPKPTNGSEQYVQRLKIEFDRRLLLLDVDQIHWIDALRNYVRINCGDRTYTLRETMQNLQEKLDPTRFVRIHRSTILNVEKVEEIQCREGGGYLVVLPGDRKLAVSRRRRDCLDRFLK